MGLIEIEEGASPLSMYFYVCAAAAYSFPLFRLEVLSLSPRGVGPCRVCLPFTAISTLLAAEREETDRGDD